MRIDFLGTGAGNFRGSRRQACSTLLDTVLLDCGAGATGRLHDLHRFDRVEAVLVSHLHSDHISGLFDFLLHTLITGRDRPLTVVSPPGLGDLLRAAFRARMTVADPADLYPFRLVEGESVELTVGAWTIRSVPLDHTILNLGYRLSTDRLSVFYSGDTREPSAARSVRADYLVHEGTYATEDAGLAQRYGHSTGAQSAETAAAMGVRRLWINHIGDRPDADRRIAAEARRVFPDTVVVEDRASYEL